MSNNVLKIEDVIFDLERANALLSCYEDFVTSEGILPDNADFTKSAVAAISFTSRLEAYRTIYESAQDIFTQKIEELKNIFNILMEEVRS